MGSFGAITHTTNSDKIKEGTWAEINRGKMPRVNRSNWKPFMGGLSPINSVGVNGNRYAELQEKSEISNLKGNWELIEINMDSGAVDNVANSATAKGFGVKETIMSTSGG